MDRGAASASSIPQKGRSGFVGFRISGMIALLSSLGAGAAAVGVLVLEEVDRESSAVLRADLEARQEAGRSALGALEQAKAEIERLERSESEAQRRVAQSEARFLANVAARDLDLHAGDEPSERANRALEAVSHAAQGGRATILGGDGLEPIDGEALSSEERAALIDAAARSGGGSFVLERSASVLAAATAAGGFLAVARVAVPGPAANLSAIDHAVGALVNLGEAPHPLAPPESAAPVVLAAGLLASLLAYFWARAQVGAPLDATLSRAEAFAHGDNAARADGQRGGRDARELARMVNTLIERAERLKRQGQSTRDEDIAALARVLEDLAKGELSGALPEVAEPLDVIQRALARAQQEMLDRIRTVRDLSVEIASSAAAVAPAAQRVRGAALGQLETLAQLSEAVGQGAGEVKGARDRLDGVIGKLSSFAAEERKVAGAFRAVLLGTSRRAQDLRRDVARVEALVATAETLEDAMDLLAATVDPKLAETNPPTRSRVSAAVGEGRAAVELIGRELALLRDELGELASSLEGTVGALPESPPAIASSITGTLHEAASALVHVAESAARGVRTLERAAHDEFEGADEIQRGALLTSELAPRLGAALAAFHLSTSFEAELLARVERWREEARRAHESADGLTEDGRALVRQVVESGEAVRARLARLVSVTESAMDVIRG